MRYNSFVRFLSASFLWAGAFLLLFCGRAMAQDAATFANLTPEQIVAQSAFSPSDIEKDILRGYVAKRFPETVPGLFARAWMEIRANHPQKALELLRSCLQKDPAYRVALHNMTALATGQERQDAYDRLLTLEADAPGDALYGVLLPLYLDYHARKSPQETQRFVAEWRKKRPGYFFFDVTAGMEAEFERHDYKSAEAHFLDALAKKPLTFDPYQRLTDMRLGTMSDGATPIQTRLSYLKPIADFIAYSKAALQTAAPEKARSLRGGIHSASLYLGDQQKLIFKDSAASFAAYRAAFHAYPTAESAMRAFREGKRDFPKEAAAFLISSNEALPHNPYLLADLGEYYVNRVELKKAEPLLDASLAYAPTEAARINALLDLGNLYGASSFDLERERNLYLDAIKNVEDPQRLYEALIVNRMSANDYSGALSAINALQDWMTAHHVPVRRAYFLTHRAAANYLIDQQERARNAAASRAANGQGAALVPDQTLTASHDGKYLITGSRPMQLWDVEGNYIRDLGRGGAALQFSPDDRYVATIYTQALIGSGFFSAIHIYDIQTGHLAARIMDQRGVSALSWSPDGKRIAYTTPDGRLTVYDLPSRKKVLLARTGFEKDNYSLLLWDRNGKFIATGVSEDVVLRCWEPATLRLLRTLPGVSWPHSLAQTADGKYFVCADDARILSVWDTAQWKRRQIPVPALSNSLTAHPTADQVVMGDFGGGKNPKIVSVDVAKMKIIAQAPAGQNNARYAMPRDGKRLFEARRKVITIYDGVTLKRIGQMNDKIGPALGAVPDAANPLYATRDAKGIYVWEVPSGKKVGEWAGDYDNALAYGPNQFLATMRDAKAGRTHLFLLDVETGNRKPLFDVPLKLDQIRASAGGLLVVAGKPFPASEYEVAENGVVIAYRREDLREVGRVSVPFVTEYLSYSAVFGAGFTGVDVNGNEVVVSTYWEDGFGRGATYTRALRIFDLKTGARKVLLPTGNLIYDVAYTDENPRRILLKTPDGEFLSDAKTGQYVGATPNFSSENYLSLKTGERIRWTEDTVERLPAGMESDGRLPSGGKRLLFDDLILNATIFEDINCMAILTQHNVIQFYNLTTFEKEREFVSQQRENNPVKK